MLNGLLKCLLEFLKLNVYLGVGNNFQSPVEQGLKYHVSFIGRGGDPTAPLLCAKIAPGVPDLTELKMLDPKSYFKKYYSIDFEQFLKYKFGSRTFNSVRSGTPGAILAHNNGAVESPPLPMN